MCLAALVFFIPIFSYMSPIPEFLNSQDPCQVASQADASWLQLRLTRLAPSTQNTININQLIHQVIEGRNTYPIGKPPSAVFWREDGVSGEDVYCHNGQPLVLTLVGRYAADLSEPHYPGRQCRELAIVPVRRVDSAYVWDFLKSVSARKGAFYLFKLRL